MKQWDVIIIGAGIAGLTQALSLSQQGFSVVVVDQGKEPLPWCVTESWDNRVFALTHQSQRLLEHLDVWSGVIERRVRPFDRMQLWWPGHLPQAKILSAVDAAQADLGAIVEQRVLRDALWHKVKNLATFHWSTSWQDLSASAEGASLNLSSGQYLHGALLIAADGAASPVRHYLGMPALSWSYEAKALVATIHSELPHQNMARQVFHREGTLALLPLSDPHLSSLVWSVPLERAEALLRLSDTAFAKALALAVDQQLGVLSLVTERMSFALQALCAEHFAEQSLVFIADAAHVLHPLAGQGLNLGLSDVACLTEVLVKAKALNRPLGHHSVLKPYARGRKVAAKHMILLMSALEKGGRFSAKYPNIMSKLINLPLAHSALLKTFTTTFALTALNQ